MTTLQEKCRKYLKEYNLNQKNFCLKYKCNESKFSQWLNKKIENYKDGENAAKIFIKECEEKQSTDILKLCEIIKNIKITGVPKERKDREGYIYIFQTPENKKILKVGRTIDVEKRLKQEQTSNPTLELIHKFKTKDRVKAEEFAHNLLKGSRNKKKGPGNEWFTCSMEEAVLACMKAVLSIDSLPQKKEE